MSYYTKQTLDFSKMPMSLVNKIVDFYVSVMNKIDNGKREDLKFDIEEYHNDFLWKYNDLKSSDAQASLRKMVSENVYFYLNELDPDTEKELKKYVPANSYSDPCTTCYMFQIDDYGHAYLDEQFNLKYNTDHFFNEPFDLIGNRIIWDNTGYVQEFKNCADAESYIKKYVCDCGDATGNFIEFADSKAGAIEIINDYIKNNELDKPEDEDDEMLLEELNDILKDLNKTEVKNKTNKSLIHRYSI